MTSDGGVVRDLPHDATVVVSGPAHLPAVTVAVASMLCAQLGAAVSTSMFHAIGPAGTAWLRLSWAAVIFVVMVRPRPWAMPRRDVGSAVMLGLASAGTTLLFFEAIARIPLATAVAVEFLGPLTIAMRRRSHRAGLAWPALAGCGVLLVTQPWRTATIDVAGVGLALGAGACWAAYILLTQRVGDRISGLAGLALSLPAAALPATVLAAPHALPRLTFGVVIAGVGLALLLPILPYTLELLALRQLTTAAFGTLMSAEPAIALLVGIVVLRQLPQPTQVVGILLVTVAASGAARSGRRSPG